MRPYTHTFYMDVRATVSCSAMCPQAVPTAALFLSWTSTDDCHVPRQLVILPACVCADELDALRVAGTLKRPFKTSPELVNYTQLVSLMA